MGLVLAGSGTSWFLLSEFGYEAALDVFEQGKLSSLGNFSYWKLIRLFSVKQCSDLDPHWFVSTEYWPNTWFPAFKTMAFVPTLVWIIIHKVYFSCQNTIFCVGKDWPGSGSPWIFIGFAPWIRILIEIKSWIRIRIHFYKVTLNLRDNLIMSFFTWPNFNFASEMILREWIQACLLLKGLEYLGMWTFNCYFLASKLRYSGPM